MRVIAGKLGGRRLHAPKGQGTRPTSDRVKEALFSKLGPLDDARVLDLFAGTGALGIEALSRRACSAVFVEHAPFALASLKKNLDELALGPVSVVVASRVERATGRLVDLGPFDCVLVDPPYVDAEAAVAVLDGLATKGVFAPDATIVLEHGLRARIEPVALELVDERAYGDTVLTFLKPLEREPVATETSLRE